MNQNDISLITSMLPCMQHIIERQMGYLLADLTIYRSNDPKFSHVLKLAALERDWDYDVGLRSVGLYLYMRRRSSGDIAYKIRRYDYAPAPEFRPGSENMHKQIINGFDYWWWSTESVLNASKLAGEKVMVFKKELVERTFVHSDNT